MWIRAAASGLTFGLVFALSACSSDGDGGPGGASGSSGSGGAAGGGGVSAGPCGVTAEACFVSGSACPGAECLARVDNTGDKKQFRFSQMQVESPDALTAPFMQDAIITHKIDFDQADCRQVGTAQFAVLLEYDSAASTLTVGGGVPQKLLGDPKDGACYADFTDPNSSIQVAPVTQPATLTGSSLSAKYTKVVLPIYLSDSVDDYVLLPLNEMTISATLSADNDCIGSFNPSKLNPAYSCGTDEGVFAWENAGDLDGYITVEESDTVLVESLGITLCVLLSGDRTRWDGTNRDCKTSQGFTETGGLPKGNWCATTNSPATPGSCEDAYKLITHFAASGLKINGRYQNGSCAP